MKGYRSKQEASVPASTPKKRIAGGYEGKPNCSHGWGEKVCVHLVRGAKEGGKGGGRAEGVEGDFTGADVHNLVIGLLWHVHKHGEPGVLLAGEEAP